MPCPANVWEKGAFPIKKSGLCPGTIDLSRRGWLGLASGTFPALSHGFFIGPPPRDGAFAKARAEGLGGGIAQDRDTKCRSVPDRIGHFVEALGTFGFHLGQTLGKGASGMASTLKDCLGEVGG